MNSASGSVALVGRIVLGLIFVLAGYSKLGTIASTVTYMASHGIPLSGIPVYGAIIVELIGGLAQMVGLYARWAAGALGLYTLALGLIFHDYWSAPITTARVQYAFFFEHLSMIGGMLIVVALGAGPLSLDAWRRRVAVEGGAEAGEH